MRTKLTLAIGLIALLGFGAVPAQADAAYYAASRVTADKPNFHIDLTVRGNRITEINLRASQRCAYPNPDHAAAVWRGGFDRPIRIRANGRFRKVYRFSGAEYFSSAGILGRVSGNRIVGFVHSRVFDNLAGQSKCWTGRSWRDPWVRFVARRQRRP